MTKGTLFLVLAAASFAVAAQQQQPAPKPSGKAASPSSDKELVDRARTQGSAGGTKPVPPEERQAVGAGAGPHLHDTRPSPSKLPRDEPVAPSR